MYNLHNSERAILIQGYFSWVTALARTAQQRIMEIAITRCCYLVVRVAN